MKSQSVREQAENLAAEHFMVIKELKNGNFALTTKGGRIIMSDIEVRLWHRIVQYYKDKK